MGLLAAAGIAAASDVNAAKDKKLLLVQDDAQETMVSKVYELKHTIAGDITPFVLGAVKRYNVNSSVERLNYSAGKKQFLVVTTPPSMMKFVDDMIKDLDRPGTKDAEGSIIEGTGIYRFAYLPKHRSTDDMLNALNNLVRSSDGRVYRDSVSNLLYWKDSLSDGKDIMRWAVAVDRPVPQVELSFSVYEVRKSTLDDIGIDYLAWKNGPGLEMFQIGLESLALETVEKAFANMDQFSSFAYGGMFVAPQFDMSFVRCLSQKGDAKVAATGTLTVVNSYTKTYSVSFGPQLQNIEKNSSDKTSITGTNNSGFSVSVSKPVICFKAIGEKDEVYNGDNFELTTYAKLGGSVQFGYELTNQNVVERNNRGDQLTDKSVVKSNLTIELGGERLLAVYDLKQQVEQTIGIPFLCEIPIVKYLFSTTTKIDEDSKLFVTVKARLVHPEDNYAAWSGKLLSENDFK